MYRLQKHTILFMPQCSHDEYSQMTAGIVVLNLNQMCILQNVVAAKYPMIYH